MSTPDGAERPPRDLCHYCRHGRICRIIRRATAQQPDVYDIMLRSRKYTEGHPHRPVPEPHPTELPEWGSCTCNGWRVRRAHRKHHERVGFSHSEACLREDFARSKVRWTGYYWHDLLLYIKNESPFLACFLANDFHPVSRLERWFHTVLNIFFVAFIACALLEGTECVRIKVTSCVDDVTFAAALSNVTFAAALSNLSTASDLEPPQAWTCCAATSVGIAYFLNGAFETVGGTNYGLSFYSLLVNTAFSVATAELVACNCFQQVGSTKICGCTVTAYDRRRRCENLGYVCIFVLSLPLLVGVPWFFSYMLDKSLWDDLLIDFLISKAAALVGGTLIQCLVFSAHFYQQRNVPDHHFHITAEQFRKKVKNIHTAGVHFGPPKQSQKQKQKQKPKSHVTSIPAGAIILPPHRRP